MNAQRLAMLVAEVSLAEDRPLAGELRLVPNASARDMASASEAGDLERALRIAGFDEELSALGTDCPRALPVASALLDRLPSTGRLYAPLSQTAAYFLLVFVVQMAILSLLRSKLFGVMRHIARDFDLGAPFRWEVALGLFAVGALLLLAVGVLGAIQWKRLPGWGRHLTRAREASLIAALSQAGAPPDVITRWVRRARALPGLDEGTLSEDLLSIAADSGVRAERSMTRFVTAVRIAGFGLLTLLALGTTLDVYLFVASLAQVR